jgi:hypothetical protein
MKLQEITSTSSQFLNTYEEVEKWLKMYNVNKYTINPQTLEVDVHGNVDIIGTRMKYLPVQFNIVYGSFDCCKNKLTTLKGSPKIVNGDFNCYWNKLTNLDFCPKIINGAFSCSVNPITSISGLHKQCKLIGKTLYLPNSVTSGLLSILLIKNLKEIRFQNTILVQNIINKHLESDRNITKCQMELIDSGFEEYATL